ncbi:pseudouridine synthase [Phenylobacterium montanum]|uniref:pseudouridine synthase n=1 Tax=Phenylobacterium montanum TaxID=2823693 RepID=UPI0035E401E1
MAKVLARAGVASRRDVEKLIAEGRVALNGEVLTTPAIKVGPDDLLTVDGAPVGEAEPTRVWRYHKPTGLVTTHKDPKGRPTVFEHLPEGLPRVISVGRLDLNSEGLLLLTNDGALARALEMPTNGLVRRYRARARGHTTQAKLDTLLNGITVEGVHYGPIEARLDKAKEGGTAANLWITVTLTEGKNREVRKVLEALGLIVNRLIRLSYGPFQLGTLEAGEVEEVGPRVIREQLAAHIDPASLPSADRRIAPPARAAVAERPAAGDGQRRGGGQAKARPAPERPAKAKTEYKPGWAKPKKRPSRGPVKTVRGSPEGRPSATKPSPGSPKAGARPQGKPGAPRRGPPKGAGPRPRG